MFAIGDKIFYPVHGAGVIEAIEEREILGEKHQYYVLNMLLRELQIMVPIKNISNLGIRKVVESDILDDVMTIFDDQDPEIMANTMQRQRINADKIKSGNIFDFAEVIRDLSSIERKRVLGSADKTMLDNALQMMISELMLVKNLSTEQASTLLNKAIRCQ
ncbi:CarD family transcriptional regulator [Brevibacillus sp. SYSU BS000544]|uniref:CarD family transcriptional regulator n=1 Tax=Brevibacillus sp. SYSU BS000544 TaxID=3416443 RepID=UPI003CE51D1C